MRNQWARLELDKRGELRKLFYQDIRRAPGEQIATFCTRYRTLVADLGREGIKLPSGELGWFLKDRLGLDPIRMQLLETALGTRDSYDDVEAESLRLFRELHLSYPLHRRAVEGRAPLLQRFLSQPTSQSSTRPSLPSSASSVVTNRTFRSSSSGASSKAPPFRRPFQRQAYVAEAPVEEYEAEFEEDDEELEPSNEVQVASNLEDIIQNEAEVLAAELQELEETGEVDPAVLESLEEGVERAAESLITMREARTKINEIKKDRGFGGKGSSHSASPKSKMTRNQVAHKKAKTPCLDCGEHGHWAGDPGCLKPGQGLFKPKKDRKEADQRSQACKITETLAVEEGEGSPVPLEAALNGYQEVSMAASPLLAQDKKLVGALDSACNRTCAGSLWLESNLVKLKDAPSSIQSLLKEQPEKEFFRFGNGGVQQSQRRVRLPMVVGNNLVVVWVSVVEVPSLGLLLGRDFLDGIGAVLNFRSKELIAEYLDGDVIALRQLAAGHSALAIAPAAWPTPGRTRWRTFGQDGVLEFQMSSNKSLQCKLDFGKKSFVGAHERMVTEQFHGSQCFALRPERR